MNLSFVIGNLGSDAEVKDSNGQRFVTFSVADSRKIKKQDGTQVDVTNWVDCIISDVNHPVLPYLKAGVKVCVIGSSSLRVFSSKKDRMMKAGQTIHVFNIELCGGSSDDVPHQVIDPETALVYEVQKYYWVPFDTKEMKKEGIKLMVDAKGRQYGMNAQGFVAPVPDEDAQSDVNKEDGK